MKSEWDQAIAASADPERARAGFEQLSVFPDACAGVDATLAGRLAAVFACSPVMTAQLASHPEWLPAILHPKWLSAPRNPQGLARELNEAIALTGESDFEGRLRTVRLFKQRELLRVAARDLGGIAGTPETIGEISNIADVCLSAVLKVCLDRFSNRLGAPFHQDAKGRWMETAFSVIALGKLGGRELNYSSDVDLLFVYGSEGHVYRTRPKGRKAPPALTSNHQFFTRLAKEFIAEVTAITPEGGLFRVDMRLRPEGDSGPLARSLDGYENYYSQHGQTWERMMLMKARLLAGDTLLGGEFLEMIQPFRFPRSLSERVLLEIAEMKRRIEVEVVKSGELDRNVKLGRGGIREVEFIVQTLQLLNAGRQPFLQITQTLPCLSKLAQYGLLTDGEAASLHAAYCFLRNAEHRLQMEHGMQTHTLPEKSKPLLRLAKLMGFGPVKAFSARHQEHRECVRSIYERFVHPGEQSTTGLLPGDPDENLGEWESLLKEHRFRDPQKAMRLVRGFIHGPGFVHVSRRTAQLAKELLQRLLALCRNPAPRNRLLSDPDRVLARLDSFVAAYGSRTVLFETWINNPPVFEMLVLLFDRSEFLAETAIRVPDLVEDLSQSGRLMRSKDRDEILAELRFGLDDEDQLSWLRRYHRAEFMRIGLRDVLGLMDDDQRDSELTALADACVCHALEVEVRRQKWTKAPFAVVGLGRLGGREITFGSDLDMLFVAPGDASVTTKELSAAKTIFDMLSLPTDWGVAYTTDARLRPDGDKGLLVLNLDAYEKYYRQRARLWEIQTLSRSRFVGGNAKVGASFVNMVSQLADFSAPRKDIKAWSADWKQQIAAMRLRIEKERTPPGKDELAIKTGTGGLMDVEFVAQALCLESGIHEPNTRRALERAKDLGKSGSDMLGALLRCHQFLRRVESILRRWSYVGEHILPEDPCAQERVAIRCGFESREAFLKELTEVRQRVRSTYQSLLR